MAQGSPFTNKQEYNKHRKLKHMQWIFAQQEIFLSPDALPSPFGDKKF